jgi:hypothetical protein
VSRSAASGSKEQSARQSPFRSDSVDPKVSIFIYTFLCRAAFSPATRTVRCNFMRRLLHPPRSTLGSSARCGIVSFAGYAAMDTSTNARPRIVRASCRQGPPLRRAPTLRCAAEPSRRLTASETLKKRTMPAAKVTAQASCHHRSPNAGAKPQDRGSTGESPCSRADERPPARRCGRIGIDQDDRHR